MSPEGLKDLRVGDAVMDEEDALTLCDGQVVAVSKKGVMVQWWDGRKSFYPFARPGLAFDLERGDPT